MPIGPVTAFGATALLNTLRTNVQVIEAYIRGEIDAQDFQDLLKVLHGRRDSVHRVYGSRWTSTAEPFQEAGVNDPAVDTWDLDRDAQLDFTSYGDIDADYWNIPTQQYVIGAATAFQRFTWEKLGNVPTQFANGTGKRIDTDNWSFRNWLFNAPEPDTVLGGNLANFVDGRKAAKRFSGEEYWDRWLTVPYATKRIWIPGPCVLHVSANATGTWNHNLSPYHERDSDNVQPGDDHVWGDKFDQTNELPAFFRLFIDRDNDKEWRGFSWEVNGETFYANWSPIQDYPQVGYGGPGEAPLSGEMLGREWSFTNSPRGKAEVASQIFVPVKGWYNISMRYNSRYVHGWIKDLGAGFYDWMEEFWVKPATVGFRPGYITRARWESSGIGAIAAFNRTQTQSDDLGVEFGT